MIRPEDYSVWKNKSKISNTISSCEASFPGKSNLTVFRIHVRLDNFSAERGWFYRTGDCPKNESELWDKICSYEAMFLSESSSKIRDIWIHLVEIPGLYDRLVRQVIQNV